MDYEMRRFDMEHFEGEGTMGDCFRCCVAMMLSRFDPALKLSDVPHFFYESGRKGIDVARKMAADRGLSWYSPMMIPGAEEYCDPSPLALLTSYMVGGKPWIASGPSPRNETILHCVVMVGHQMFHDPHPDRSGCYGLYDATFIERVPATVIIDRADLTPSVS